MRKEKLPLTLAVVLAALVMLWMYAGIGSVWSRQGLREVESQEELESHRRSVEFFSPPSNQLLGTASRSLAQIDLSQECEEEYSTFCGEENTNGTGMPSLLFRCD